ncbi:unnamed protein product [Darwinula stevensoni]|uniref:Uncharacterized protein n=1 Tax=Darwinula stevensoni TaxID=69355 RepID=A0A7R9ADS8_9CRUS|nr:unnamed protein product [Darwinula stevensoni]CAG0901366.1 unnamed protein product [Darwinula stevensoni]
MRGKVCETPSPFVGVEKQREQVLVGIVGALFLTLLFSGIVMGIGRRRRKLRHEALGEQIPDSMSPYDWTIKFRAKTEEADSRNPALEPSLIFLEADTEDPEQSSELLAVSDRLEDGRTMKAFMQA